MHRQGPGPQGRAVAVQPEVIAVEASDIGRLRPVVRRAGKEGHRIGHAQLLAVVDQRRPGHARRKHERRRRALQAVEEGGRRGVPHRLVVVRSKAQAPGRLRQIGKGGVDLRGEGADGGVLLPHPLQRAVEGPGVRLVEAYFMHLRPRRLGQHQHLLAGLHRVNRVLPEVERHRVGHVGPVAVNVKLANPVLHDVDHLLPRPRVLKVELHHVRPVGRVAVQDRHRKAIDRPVAVHVRVLVQPRMVPGRVVGYEVDDDVHVSGVCRIHERPEVCFRPVVRIHVVVVPNRVRGPERPDVALAPLFADRVDGHEPERVDAHRLNLVEPPDESLEGALRGGVRDEHLVDGGVLHPGRLAHSVNGGGGGLVRRARASDEADRECGCEREKNRAVGHNEDGNWTRHNCARRSAGAPQGDRDTV